MATAMKNASALSKITVREKATVSGVASVAIAAIIASFHVHKRRANHHTNAAVASVKRYAGSRAAVSVGPITSIAAASAAKKTIGLSRYGRASRRGMT